MAGKTSSYGSNLKFRNKNGKGGYGEEDEKLIKLEDTIVRDPDNTDVSMLKLGDTVIENPKDSPLEFDEGINITSTLHNVR